jgi:hypothetical protein
MVACIYLKVMPAAIAACCMTPMLLAANAACNTSHAPKFIFMKPPKLLKAQYVSTVFGLREELRVFMIEHWAYTSRVRLLHSVRLYLYLNIRLG